MSQKTPAKPMADVGLIADGKISFCQSALSILEVLAMSGPESGTTSAIVGERIGAAVDKSRSL